ncbi:hypothetical protein AB5N19_08663 [Seiridium cardinale]
MAETRVQYDIELRGLEAAPPRAKNEAISECRNYRSSTISTGFAVPNTFMERLKAQFRSHQRFWLACAALVFLLVTIGATLGGLASNHLLVGEENHTVSNSTISASAITSSASPITASSAFIAITTSTSTSQAFSSSTTLMTTTSSKSVVASPSTIPVCSLNSFHESASFVGVYDPSVTHDQFTLIPATSAGDCCVGCFAMTRMRCNGWGWMGGKCWVVYDYPGIAPNTTCPKGYPLVTIRTSGPEEDIAGVGPCGLLD